MNFLKKAQDQANKTTGVTTPKPSVPKPSIPGAKPAIPGAKPGLPKPPVPGAGSKPVMPGVKPNIPSRPGVKPTTTTSTPEVKEEVKGPVAQKSNPFKLNKTATASETETTTTIATEETTPVAVEEKITPVVEETKLQEEVKVETENITEAPEVNEPIKEESKKEEEKPVTKKKTTSRAKKKTTTRKEETNDIPDENADTEVSEVVIPTTDMTYAEAVMSIKSTFVDEEWDAFKEDTVARLEEIHISNDMTPTALKQTISDLNALRDSVWLHYLESKTFFETLTAKDDGLIDRIKRLNSKGSNENERKVNAAIALMNYKDNGKNINLYEVLDASRARYNYTKELMEAIKYKSNAVITMLGNLKLEK